MKMILTGAVLATLAVPALAAQPQGQAPAPAQPQAQGEPAGPHTIRGQLTLFEMADYAGDYTVIDDPHRAVHTDWNIHSLSIHPGDRWQICARTQYRDCIVIDRSVPDTSVIGITGQIGSARPAPDEPSGS